MKTIVLAGGGGTRLWPLSREDFPKQFLKFNSHLSLLQKTVDRLNAPWIDSILVATNRHHFALVQEQLCDFHVDILVEPMRKNTAPAIALAVKYLETFCNATPQDPVLVLPSDHLIDPESIFLDALEQMQGVVHENKIITFGIRPTRAETGYGYIEIGKKTHPSVFKALRFVEKPDAHTAQRYVDNPHFYWNSGMFLFSIETFWAEMKRHCPEIFRLMEGSYEEALENFAKMPNLSIDYAVMEKSSEVLVCPLAVQWSDVGCWDSVYEAMAKDQNQNVKIGQVHDIDTQNCLIISSKRLISTIGLEDLLIVETEDALFISKKGHSQKVKDLVQDLVKEGRKEVTSSSVY